MIAAPVSTAPVSAIGFAIRGLRYSDWGVQLAEEQGDLLTQGHCYCMRSMAQYALGQHAVTVQTARHSIELLEQAGDPYIRFIAECHASFSSTRLGMTSAAIEFASTCFERAVRLEEKASAPGVLLAWALATNGNLPFRELRACFRNSDEDHMSYSLVGIAEGIWHLHAGRYRDAVQVLEDAWRRTRRHLVIMPYTVAGVAWLATAQREYAASLRDDQAELRRQLLRQAWRSARRSMWLSRMYPSERPHALREYGLLLCGRSKTGAGLAQLRASLQLAEQHGDVWQHALSSRECGRVELALGIAGGAERIARAEALIARVAADVRNSQVALPVSGAPIAES